MQAFLADVNKYYGEHMTYEAASDDGLITDWNHMWWAANVLLAEATDQGTFHQTTQVRTLGDLGWRMRKVSG